MARVMLVQPWNFHDEDVVRHPLVARIIRAYDRRDVARDERVETGARDDD